MTQNESLEQVPCELQPGLADTLPDDVINSGEIPDGFEDIQPSTSLPVRLALVNNYLESEGGSYEEYLKAAGLREWLCPRCRRTHWAIAELDPNARKK